jgi:ubiquinone/menaquinone biosynthesis C-methylase UbiE
MTLPSNFEELKPGMMAPWVAGDFGAMAKTLGLREAERFVSRLAIGADERALDIACDTGNVTLALARHGARATGLDMVPQLLEQARARAA